MRHIYSQHFRCALLLSGAYLYKLYILFRKKDVKPISISKHPVENMKGSKMQCTLGEGNMGILEINITESVLSNACKRPPSLNCFAALANIFFVLLSNGN